MTNPTFILASSERVSSLIADAFTAVTIVMAGFVAMVTLAVVV